MPGKHNTALTDVLVCPRGRFGRTNKSTCKIEENLDSRNVKSKFHCVGKFYMAMLGRVNLEDETYESNTCI
jgi:hypothetical protein